MAYNDRKLVSLVSKCRRDDAGLDYFPVKTRSERDSIFRLRYDAYHDQGLIRGSREASLTDWQDDESSSSIYGITLRGSLVATIRLSVISRDAKACATYSMFGEHLDPIIETGEKILDGSRLAVKCSDSAARRSIVLYTLSLAASVSARVGADHGTIIARHGHVPFYERYGFELVCGPFSYHEALTPLALMMIRLPRSVRRRPSAASHSMPPHEVQGFRPPVVGASL